jgi:hypothetical protein
MRNLKLWKHTGMLASLILLLFVFTPRAVQAHCDTMEGPVITAARTALDTGDVKPVLGWVHEDAEPELRAAFDRTLAVRKLDPAARELADQYFFETLVRLHRAGEGAPYTGLKPAGTPIEPVILTTDKALETGSPDALVKQLTAEVAAGLRERFARAAEARRHAKEGDVEAFREYVAAYVELTHYAERLDLDAKRPAAHGEHPAEHEHM